MTKLQKAFCVFLSLGFLLVLAFLPEPFFWWKNIYRTLPVDVYLERNMEQENRIEQENLAEEENEEYEQKLSDMKTSESKASEPDVSQTENEALQPQPSPVKEASAPVLPHPLIDLSAEALADFNYLLKEFYIVDSATETNPEQLNAQRFLAEDFTVDKNTDGPQILIYHSHSQEGFADSREGEEEDTVVGVGNTLSQILEDTYGYRVLHVKEAFDLMGGEMDRSKAYDYAREYLEPVLAGNPSIQVVIDLHRDGVEEGRRLVTEINGKPTAQIMFYNGLSYTINQGTVEYLPNPYIEENLAFSFQLEYEAAKYYPDFYRGIYLAGLRYNLHLCPCSLLLEAGAQTNTVEEVKNAMVPFADILNRVISTE